MVLENFSMQIGILYGYWVEYCYNFIDNPYVRLDSRIPRENKIFVNLRWGKCNLGCAESLTTPFYNK